jgi:hypothetical protein
MPFGASMMESQGSIDRRCRSRKELQRAPDKEILEEQILR